MPDIEPAVMATRYLVSCLPEGYIEADMFTVAVEYRGKSGWAVTNRGRLLGKDGTWSFCYSGPGSDREPVTDDEHAAYEAGYKAWVAEHRFGEATALRLAREVAPTLSIRGFTVADALADTEATS